jgi:hypothetical protein
MAVKTIANCTVCGGDINTKAELDTVYMLMRNAQSVPHMPCTKCRAKIEKHNAPIEAERQKEEDEKRAKRQAERDRIAAELAAAEAAKPKPPDPMDKLTEVVTAMAQSQAQTNALLAQFLTMIVPKVDSTELLKPMPHQQAYIEDAIEQQPASTTKRKSRRKG